MSCFSVPVDVKEKLLDLAAHVLKRQISMDDTIEDQFNVNRFLQLTERFYAETGIELDVNSAFVWRSIGDLAEAVDRGSLPELPKLLQLRDGDKSRPLIVFAGGLSCFLELKDLLKGLDYDGVIYGIRLSQFNKAGSEPARVCDEVKACCEELASKGITGPVSLVGYSFGGIFALELARKLEENGQEVRFLGLIDPLLSEHAWPWHIWASHTFRILMRQLRGVPGKLLNKKPLRGSPARGVHTKRKHLQLLVHLMRPFFLRYCNPAWKIYPELCAEWREDRTPDYTRSGRQLLTMRGLYRPSAYSGDLVYYRAEGGTPIFQAQQKTWSPYLLNAEWVDRRGTHLSIIAGKNGVLLGRDIGNRMKSLSTTSGRVTSDTFASGSAFPVFRQGIADGAT